MTTLKDIATKTNLSISTISLVLNGKASNIPQKTKDLVLKAAEELNYRPNHMAVALVTKRTRTIGLIVPDIRNNFFSNLAKGIEDECRRNDWTLILCNSNDIHERDIEYINMLASKGVDGILYCMAADSSLEKFNECYELLKTLNIRFIMLDRSFDTTDVLSASLNHVNGAYLATKHLLDLGHKKIGCVTGPNHLMDSNKRLKGYIMALEEAGIPFDESIIIEGNYKMESGLNAADKLISFDITSIFAFNDLMAYGVFKGLRNHGYSIPKDISIVGYDDIYFSEILEVPLTTIHQPVEQMGVAATKHLIDLIDGSIDSDVIPVYPPKLIVRNSTAKL